MPDGDGRGISESQRKEGHRHRSCVVIETVCADDLWMWHQLVGAPGSLHDINVTQQSPLYLDVTGGRWPPRGTPFTIDGSTRTLLYYLADEIYPRYAFLMSPHPRPSTEEQKTFIRLQEAIWENVERLFGVLMKRFRVALHPGRYRSLSRLVTTYKAMCILHNVCVESRRSNFMSRRRRASGGDDGTGCGVSGNASGKSDGGEGQSGGAPAGGTAAAGKLAPGRGSAGGVGGIIASTGAPAPGGGVGDVAAVMDNIDAVNTASPALKPGAHPPAVGMNAILDAWAET